MIEMDNLLKVPRCEWSHTL